ncbi:ExbD/TolR family protein [Marinomonas fungiae]|uniref:Biopolymer transport protein ExbD n=1 Tax=Marinomonas fungiae TaxID=1137284 RepID=A0A0K6IMY3_9GAMM|nr:biopolymer transporter ExbD [Marinomonas fungiae]CUB04647.1 Biopolymer transport protein ExbD [Marinomonas fungiae]
MNIEKKFIAQRDGQGDDSVIPLINVVFLMLIFFMVAGQIQKSDPIQITPPNSINEARPTSDPNVLLLIGANQELYFNDEPIELDVLEGRLTQRFEQAQDREAFWVQIKADGALAVEDMRPVFSAIRRAGLTKVSVATQLGQGQSL